MFVNVSSVINVNETSKQTELIVFLTVKMTAAAQKLNGSKPINQSILSSPCWSSVTLLCCVAPFLQQRGRRPATNHSALRLVRSCANPVCSYWLAGSKVRGQSGRECQRQTDRCLTVHRSRSSRLIRCLSCGRRDKGSGGSSSPEWSNQDSNTAETVSHKFTERSEFFSKLLIL